MKYGDAVVLVQKSAVDGSLRRLNAIVLDSRVHDHVRADRKLVAKDVEHLDLAFPVPAEATPKTRNFDEIFRPAHDVPPFVDGAWVGYEAPIVADPAEARDGDPSAEDLDAVTEEQWASEAAGEAQSGDS